MIVPDTIWNVPRETVEWIGPVTAPSGATDLELALLPRDDRPLEEDWDTPALDDGRPGYLAAGLSRGQYLLWSRYVDGPETPVHVVALIEVD